MQSRQPKPTAKDHERVCSFIAAVRDSFPDAPIIFTHGACFGLYQILRLVFPSSLPFIVEEEDHIITKIAGRYYDIYGEYVDVKGVPKTGMKPLIGRQLERWKVCAAGQRVEYMLKKYNRD